ncbi:MAG: SRPBCC domain-containing protein [Hyphomonas sp.]
MSAAPLQDIEVVIEIDAPPARVWHDMTDTARVPLWLGCMHYERRVGHVFYMQQDAGRRATGDITGATHCEILEISEPDRLVFSWFVPGTPRTTVTMTLEADGTGGTRVQLVHTGWDQFSGPEIASLRDMLAGGWSSYVLPSLKQISESDT